MQDSLCWRGADVITLAAWSCVLLSFSMLEDKSQGVQAANACSATMRYVAMSTVRESCFCQPQVDPPTTRRRLVRRSICRHTFLTWLPRVIRRSYVTSSNVGEGVQLGWTPLMVFKGHHCASALPRLKKAISHFSALSVMRACWLQLTTLSTSACILRATSSFLRPRRARARSST